MKDICVVYQKNNKTLAKKLVSKLESDGIACSVSPRDFKIEEKESIADAVENSKVLLLIIDKTSAQSKEQTDALEVALENELDVIPFVVEKIESNLYSEHFFYAFSWVDAYDESFDEAYDVLIDAYEEFSGEDASSKKGKVSKKSKKQKTDSRPIIYGLITIVLIIAGYFIYDGLSGNEEANVLVGQWRLTDYQDSLVEILQNCIIFNDGAFGYISDREHREDRQIIVEHGKPLVFGKNRDKGIILVGLKLRVAEIGQNGITEDDILVHNAHDPDPTLHLALINMKSPEFPVAFGVIRDVDAPTYEERVENQIKEVQAASKIKCMDDLMNAGNTWVVD